MREGTRAQRQSTVCRARMEELLQGTAKGQQRLEEAERRVAHGIRLVNGPPSESSSSSPTDQQIPRALAVQISRAPAAGGVAQDTAQDTVMSGRADGRRNSPRETEDDEERAKRQRNGEEDRTGDGSVKRGEDQ